VDAIFVTVPLEARGMESQESHINIACFYLEVIPITSALEHWPGLSPGPKPAARAESMCIYFYPGEHFEETRPMLSRFLVVTWYVTSP
jgi:hypothetical protein